MLEISEAEIIETMQWTVDTILIPHFMSLGLDATGEWRESLNVRAEGQTGIINGRKYTEQLVWGRRPGAMPPIAPLERWAQVKLGLSGTAAKSAAFAIAKKIASEGTNIYKEGGTDLLEILSEPTTIKRITDHLQAQYTPRVTAYLERQIQKAFV